MTQTPQCFRCKHYRDVKLETGAPMTCTAFPEGIPEEIVFNDFDHAKPHDDDHGIQFEDKTPQPDES